ncbi:MAG: hypothetical protein R2761_30155 [Acidimicrobiales bacterium]
MIATNALASLPVRDLDTAKEWYGKLLGPGSRPMDEVIEWQLERGGGLQLYVAPERAGFGSCTLVVSDIDDVARHLQSIGVARPEPTRTDQVDVIMVQDPDGNSLAFAVPKDPSLAQ